MTLKCGTAICESTRDKSMNCKPNNSPINRLICCEVQVVSICTLFQVCKSEKVKEIFKISIYSIITRGWTHGIHLRAYVRFIVIDGNELVQYSSIQYRNQILKELIQVFWRWLFLTLWKIPLKTPRKHYFFMFTLCTTHQTFIQYIAFN